MSFLYEEFLISFVMQLFKLSLLGICSQVLCLNEYDFDLIFRFGTYVVKHKSLLCQGMITQSVRFSADPRYVSSFRESSGLLVSPFLMKRLF